jgi:hypothetical protein
MGRPDLKRLEAAEGAYTFISNNLAKLLLEVDARMNGREVYTTIDRTSGLIDKIEYFGEVARINKMMELQITYTAGDFTTYTWIFYNLDGSEDSRVVETATRDINGDITGCDSVFTTTEDTKL